MAEIPGLPLAREYLAERHIHELFEVISLSLSPRMHLSSIFAPQALITGLMVEKPDDHIQFIVDALQKVTGGGRVSCQCGVF